MNVAWKRGTSGCTGEFLKLSDSVNSSALVGAVVAKSTNLLRPVEGIEFDS